MHKTCSLCKQEKHSDCFDKTRRHKDGLNSWCKECKRSYAKSKDFKRKANLKNYGLTIEDYDKLLKAQSYRCAICGRLQQDFRKRLAVDHCHETNVVRGILCENCNIGLGHFKHSPELLLSAVDYLIIKQ